MMLGEHSEAVCPDLVGRVAVVGHPVTPRHHRRHLARRHQRRGHAVRDQGAGYLILSIIIIIICHVTIIITCHVTHYELGSITCTHSHVVRGAPAIGITAAYGMAMAQKRGEDMEEAYTVLAASRPTAVNLIWALDRVCQNICIFCIR